MARSTEARRLPGPDSPPNHRDAGRACVDAIIVAVDERAIAQVSQIDFASIVFLEI